MTQRMLTLMALLVMLVTAACESTEDQPQVIAATLPANSAALQPTETRTPTLTLMPTATPIPPTQTPMPTATDVPPTATPTLTATPAPTDPPEPQREPRFALRRPIRVSDTLTQRDFLDRTYPYGDTQGGTRETHSGVEFFNPTGTTVIAAGPGRVIYAGDDAEILIGPRNNYYGNVIIIEHDHATAPDGSPLYTLYGHLDRFLVVETGVVTTGMPIAEVGQTGIAIGPHLHFEVRVGDDPFDFNSTRNPDMWLIPYPGSGLLAGRIVDAAGNPLPGLTVDVRSQRTNNLLFSFTYTGSPANSDVAWAENFTRGDLTAGQYVVTVAQDGDVKFSGRVTIEDQELTWLDIVVE